MKRIPLRARNGTVRAYALVDDADYDVLARHRWCLHRSGYAIRTDTQIGKQVSIHRVLLGLVPGDGREGDHVNGNRLDNRRENLRVVTRAQNAQNLNPHPGASSYRGVAFNSRRQKWTASVKLDRRTHFLGEFDTEDEAAAVASAFRAEHMPYSRDALKEAAAA